MKILSEGKPRTELSEEVDLEGIPICYSNLTTPVTNRTDFIQEVSYKIGMRVYIENAD